MTIDRARAIEMADAFNEQEGPYRCFFEGFGGGNALVFYMGRHDDGRPWDEIRIPGDSGMSLEELQDFCAIVGDTLDDCAESLGEIDA